MPLLCVHTPAITLRGHGRIASGGHQRAAKWRGLRAGHSFSGGTAHCCSPAHDVQWAAPMRLQGWLADSLAHARAGLNCHKPRVVRHAHRRHGAQINGQRTGGEGLACRAGRVHRTVRIHERKCQSGAQCYARPPGCWRCVCCCDRRRPASQPAGCAPLHLRCRGLRSGGAHPHRIGWRI